MPVDVKMSIRGTMWNFKLTILTFMADMKVTGHIASFDNNMCLGEKTSHRIAKLESRNRLL